jgi:hypothetical protein
MRKFVERVLELITEADSLNFTLLNDENFLLHAPFDVGEDFITGNTSEDGTGYATTVPFAAIAKILPVKADPAFRRPLR